MQAERRMSMRADNRWLQQFLKATYIHFNRALATSPRLHSVSDFREVLISEFIEERSERFNELVAGDNYDEAPSDSRYESLKSIYSEIEDELDEPSIWFDSLITGFGCKNESIDYTSHDSSPRTYPMMKQMLIENDPSEPTCANCLVNRHPTENRDGNILVQGKYNPPDCIFRSDSMLATSGMGFRLILDQHSSVRFDRELQGGFRVTQIILTSALKRRLERSHPELISNHYIETSEEISGRFLIKYGWPHSIANNSSLVSVWQSSGLGRKEKMFDSTEEKWRQKGSFQAILDDLSSLISVAETTWVPQRFKSIHELFSSNVNISDNLRWPVLRVWCPPRLMQIILGDRMERLPGMTPIFIDDTDALAAESDTNSIIVELDGIILWR